MKANNPQDKKTGEKPLIGASEWVDIGNYHHIPAKTDTGAQSSAIWASHIRVEKDGTLKFRLFDEGYSLYTGRVFKRAPGTYKVGVVRSSNGQEQIRFRVYLPIKVAGKKISALVSLADRSKNNFPLLLGRRTLVNKFIVDPGMKNVRSIPLKPKTLLSNSLNDELAKDPFKFYEKYVINGTERSKDEHRDSFER